MMIVAISLLVIANGVSAGQPAAQKANSITLCEDGGGAGWWRPAKDLVQSVQAQIIDSGGVAAAGRQGLTVRPPLRVSDVGLVRQLERTPRVCATFTEIRRANTSPPPITRWLAGDTVRHCQETPDGSWETGMLNILDNMVNGGLTRTLQGGEPLLAIDPGTRAVSEATGRRGERARVGGRYVTDVELIAHVDETPLVCVSFAN